jgi:drug/metabolite transporter (DMT)-like permease
MTRLRADLTLLLVAAIWGSAFAVQRIAGQYLNVFTFNGTRFLLAAALLYPLVLSKTPHSRPNRYALLAGCILFVASALQQAGLESTTAANAGFITSLYVVLVPLILLIVWKEKTSWISWLSAGLAVLGSLLLSTGGALRLSRGDALELVGACLWALHVIVVSRAVRLNQTHNPTFMDALAFSAGQYLVAGLLSLAAGLLTRQPLAGLAHAWWTVIYIGVLSTSVGYTLQVVAQKYAPPADAAILLSTEAVFAAFFGYLFLQEVLFPVQLVGCGLILVAILLTQVKTERSRLPEGG